MLAKIRGLFQRKRACPSIMQRPDISRLSAIWLYAVCKAMACKAPITPEQLKPTGILSLVDDEVYLAHCLELIGRALAGQDISELTAAEKMAVAMGAWVRVVSSMLASKGARAEAIKLVNGKVDKQWFADIMARYLDMEDPDTYATVMAAIQVAMSQATRISSYIEGEGDAVTEGLGARIGDLFNYGLAISNGKMRGGVPDLSGTAPDPQAFEAELKQWDNVLARMRVNRDTLEVTMQ